MGIVSDIEDMGDDDDILADHAVQHFEPDLLRGCGRWLSTLEETTSGRLWNWYRARAINSLSPSAFPDAMGRPDAFANVMVTDLSIVTAEELVRTAITHGFITGL